MKVTVKSTIKQMGNKDFLSLFAAFCESSSNLLDICRLIVGRTNISQVDPVVEQVGQWLKDVHECL